MSKLKRSTLDESCRAEASPAPTILRLRRPIYRMVGATLAVALNSTSAALPECSVPSLLKSIHDIAEVCQVGQVYRTETLMSSVLAWGASFLLPYPEKGRGIISVARSQGFYARSDNPSDVYTLHPTAKVRFSLHTTDRCDARTKNRQPSSL